VLHCVTVAVCCSVLQCVAVCCSVLHMSFDCSVLQCGAVCCSVLHMFFRVLKSNDHSNAYVKTRYSALQLQCVAVCCSVLQLQCIAVFCSVLQYVAYVLRELKCNDHPVL